MSGIVRTERVQVVVIGAGQAGLSVGYHLAQRGIQFVILEAKERIGDSWRERWDSLRLFTPGRLDGLDGMPFPTPGHRFPTKDEMADYLEAYAGRFRCPVRTGVRVTGLTRRGDRYLVLAGDLRFEADHVVVAMATYQEPRIPAFAGELATEIRQLHSRGVPAAGAAPAGRRAGGGRGQLRGGDRARGGARAGTRPGSRGETPGRCRSGSTAMLSRFVLQPLLLRVIFHRLLTVDTPMGRKVRPRVISLRRAAHPDQAQGPPRRRRAAGTRTAGTKDGRPVLEDGTVLDVTNVVWCTGFHPGFSWIDLPGARRARRAGARARAAAAGAGALVRRAALPLRDVVHDDPRGRDGTRSGSRRRWRSGCIGCGHAGAGRRLSRRPDNHPFL